MANTYTLNYINVGNNPNDGQGEPLRTAFVKINQNLSNVYNFASEAANTATAAAILAANVSGGGGANLIGYTTLSYLSNVVANIVNLSSLNNALANLNYISLPALNNALANLYTVNLPTLNNALANLNYISLPALNNALANLYTVNLPTLNNALANLNYINLPALNNAIANISTVNLGALNNALANINISNLSNFTNVFNSIAANAANVAKVGIVSNLTANGTANGQAIYNSTDSSLYIWQGNSWIKPGAYYTPTATSIASVEIWNTTPKPTSNLFEGRTILYNADSNLYIYVNSAWTSYNQYIQGSGTPTISANSISTNMLQSGIITANKIATGAIVAGKIAAGAITATEIAAGNITASLLATDSVIAGKIAAGVITATEIATGAITATQIAANAITADKINALAITAGKIAAGAITATEIGANAITANKIDVDAVTANKIAAGAIIAGKIGAGAVTANEIAANAITANKIDVDAVTANKIAAGAIIAGKIGANAITATEIAAGAITTNKLGAGVVTANEIGAGAIIAGKIGANAITANEIAANAITANKIQAGAITASKIAAGTITANEIAANAVTANKIDGRDLVIRDSSGTPLFDVGGILSASVKVGPGGTTLGTLAGIVPLLFVGSGSTFPTSPTINNVFKLTTDNNTYVYTSTGWTLFVPGGGTGKSAYQTAVDGGFTGTEAQWLASLKGTNGVTTTVTLDGVRGTAQVAYATTGTSWSDSVANAGLASFGFAGKITMDQVTLYNLSTGYSETRFWNGSAWTAIAAYLNGSLLVNGTVGATKIAAGSIDATKIAASTITADKLSVTSLSALSANIGVITTGRIQGDVIFSGNISAASGTFSGKLTAQAIDAVDTTNIKNNAVTNGTTEYREYTVLSVSSAYQNLGIIPIYVDTVNTRYELEISGFMQGNRISSYRTGYGQQTSYQLSYNYQYFLYKVFFPNGYSGAGYNVPGISELVDISNPRFPAIPDPNNPTGFYPMKSGVLSFENFSGLKNGQDVFFYQKFRDIFSITQSLGYYKYFLYVRNTDTSGYIANYYYPGFETGIYLLNSNFSITEFKK